MVFCSLIVLINFEKKIAQVLDSFFWWYIPKTKKRHDLFKVHTFQESQKILENNLPIYFDVTKYIFTVPEWLDLDLDLRIVIENPSFSEAFKKDGVE